MADPRITKAFEDGRVTEEGITPEFLSESKDKPAIIAIVFVTALTFFIVCCRLLSRGFIVKRFGFDDALALISLICLIAFVVLCIILINLGSGRHFAFIQYVLDVPTILHTQVLDFAAHIIYTSALLLCRVSGLAFYYRLCALHAGFRTAIHVVFAILVAGFLPQLFLLIFHCRPVTGYWPYGWEPIADDYSCLQWGVVYSVNSSVSLLCDFLLFGIPVAMLRILEMPRKRKVQLGCILLPGIAVIAISIARLILVIRGQWEADMSWSYNPMLGVEVSEIGATLIALSIPGVKPLFDRFILRKNRSENTSGTSTYNNYNNNIKTYGSRPTRLSTLLHTRHSMLGSSENTANYAADIRADTVNADTGSTANSTDGIYVRVDFDVKEGRASMA